MSVDIYDIIEDAKEWRTNPNDRIRRLEEDSDSIEVTDTRLANEITTDHDHPQFITLSEAQELIDQVSAPITQETATIISTGAGTGVDISAKSFNSLRLTATGNANGGTFVSATIQIELSDNNTDWEPEDQNILTITTANPHDFIWIDYAARFMRYNVLTLVKTGDGDIDLTLEALT